MFRKLNDVAAVFDALRHLAIPEVPDVASRIASVDVRDGVVTITLAAMTNGCEVSTDSLTSAIRDSVSALEGVVAVEVEAAPRPRSSIIPDEGPSAQQIEAGRGYEGPLPVFQWEIDPSDSTRVHGSADVTEGDWQFSIWWQLHPCDLVYASLEATNTSPTAASASRAQIVNLVYDRQRNGIVAVYGTASDLRPFVVAFAKAYGTEVSAPLSSR